MPRPPKPKNDGNSDKKPAKPRKRERPKGLLGLQDDGHKCVLPRLCDFSRETVGQVLVDEILKCLPGDVQKSILKELFPKNQRPRLTLITRLCKDKPRNSLAFLAHWLNRVGYEPSVLLSRRECAVSYRLLMSSIAKLGPIPRQKTYISEQDDAPSQAPVRDADFYEAQLERAREACRRFSQVVAPSCWTAYFWNARQNRTSSLGTGDLHVEEAMHGFSKFQDLPTLLISEQGSLVLYPPFPSAQQRILLRGSFQSREKTENGRLIAVKMRWGRSRLVLFMNWREGFKPDANHPLARMWTASAETRTTGGIADEMAQVAQSLESAARYFLGWLAASQIDISQQVDPVPTATPDDLIISTGKAARQRAQNISGDHTASLASTIEQALKTSEERDVECRIHWVKKGAAGQPDILQAQEGDYHGLPGPPELPISVLENGFVSPGGSVSAQVAHWNAGLLIKDFNRTIPGANLRWKDIYIRRTERVCDSAILIPIVAQADETNKTNQLIDGVISVECFGKPDLTPSDVRRIELIGHVYSKLYAALKVSSSLDDKDREILNEILDAKKKHRTFQRLCKRFCRYVIQKLNGDIVYVCIYDAQMDFFRPMGITGSRNNVLRLLEIPDALANLGLGRFDDAMRKQLLEQYKESNELGGIHGLVEHAIGSLLQPKPNGVTEEVFRSTRSRFLSNATTHHGRGQSETLSFARARLAIPFTQDENSAPSGVIWICWSEVPKAEPDIGELVNNESAFCEAVKRKIAIVSEVVASLYRIHCYCRPDTTSEPFPLA